MRICRMRLLFLQLCSGSPPFPHRTRSAGLWQGPYVSALKAASFLHYPSKEEKLPQRGGFSSFFEILKT